jgi:5-formyltetrahydrofolate cyclo-ligase
MSVEKQVIRRDLRERRRGLSAALVEAASVAVCDQLRVFPPFQAAASVVAYLSHEKEISIHPLLEEIGQSESRLYLPDTATPQGFVRWHPGSPLVNGRGGVPQPAAGLAEVPATPAIVLIPIVAWNEWGARLGRGGGFYDRILATLTEGFTRVGLAYEFQEFPKLPQDEWDVSMQYVITERRVVTCRGERLVRRALLQKGGMQL